MHYVLKGYGLLRNLKTVHATWLCLTLLLSLIMQDCANDNGAKFAPTKCSVNLSGKTERFLKLMPHLTSVQPSAKLFLVKQGLHRKVMIQTEIFRVKRRSALGLQKRRAEELIYKLYRESVATCLLKFWLVIHVNFVEMEAVKHITLMDPKLLCTDQQSLEEPSSHRCNREVLLNRKNKKNNGRKPNTRFNKVRQICLRPRDKKERFLY